MPMYDITNGKGKLVKPEQMEKTAHFKKIKKEVSANSWKMICRILKESVEDCVSKGVTKNKLVWTKMGAMFGYNSDRPKYDVERLWERVVEIVGDGKECKEAVGILLKWEISKRSETWLCYVQTTDEIDSTTGKLIKVSSYWINENFTPPKNERTGFSLNDLAKKFSSGRAYAK